MALQSTVNVKQGFGLVGEFYDNSPRRAHAYILKTNSSQVPVIGRAFTATSNEGEAKIGGTGVFKGILVSPKEHVVQGLSASLDLADGTVGTLCTFGHIIVKVASAVAEGNGAQYNNTTGEISTPATQGTADSGCTLIPNSKFVFYGAAANGLAVLELSL